MKFRKYVLSVVCALLITGGLFASSVDEHVNNAAEKSISAEIHNMIKKLDIDFEELDNQTIKVKFMVNENSELIIVSTGDSDIDSTIKSALNYKEVETDGIKRYSLYAVNIKFEAK